MPPKFGSIKRANIDNDPSSTNRKISNYVVSEGNDGKLANTSGIVKNNIKNWLSRYIPINDSVELKDAYILNYAVEYVVAYDRNFDPSTVLFASQQALENYLNTDLYIGEPLYITELYNVLNRVPGVVDVKKVRIKNKTGGSYSGNSLNFNKVLSKDGTFIRVPKNAILELKYPNIDIKGTVK